MSWGHEPDAASYVGLAQGYLADERFVAYYDEPCGRGATQFLVDAIQKFAE